MKSGKSSNQFDAVDPAVLLQLTKKEHNINGAEINQTLSYLSQCNIAVSQKMISQGVHTSAELGECARDI